MNVRVEMENLKVLVGAEKESSSSTATAVVRQVRQALGLRGTRQAEGEQAQVTAEQEEEARQTRVQERQAVEAEVPAAAARTRKPRSPSAGRA